MTGLDAVAASQRVGRQWLGVGAGREQRGWNQSRVGRPISLAGRAIKDCSLPAAMQQRLGGWLHS